MLLARASRFINSHKCARKSHARDRVRVSAASQYAKHVAVFSAFFFSSAGERAQCAKRFSVQNTTHTHTQTHVPREKESRESRPAVPPGGGICLLRPKFACNARSWHSTARICI